MSGGTEICVNVQTPAASDHSLLLRDIPRTASVTVVSAHQLLHRYFDGPTAWLGRANALDAALTPPSPGEGKPLTGDDAACWPRSSATGARASPSWPRPPAGRRRPSPDG
ncbi:hypothetical protein [Amycolatopsis sp. NPDC049159]|uniref:hypothetical protein n=1 Tax=Amycolatopsis sp. NPDC049159 TaxID=3157210 RepID=UPI0033E28DDC